jgi:non-heme chloroperoxidase
MKVASYRRLEVRTPDGLRIAAQDWARPASGRDVLLIHGYSQSNLCWLKQCSGPLADEFRLVTYDIRGHGGSDKPLAADFYGDAERWAGEIEAVIRAAQLDHPILVFWSYAGRIALDYLSRRGDGGVSGLVFVSATSALDATMTGPAAPLLRHMTEGDLAANIEATTAFLQACTASALSAEDLSFMLAYNMVVPPVIRAHLIGRPADYRATLRALKVPVQVMHGGADALILPSMGDHTVANTRNARHVLYPGIGHMPFWEIPEQFDRDLAIFLRDTPRPRP